ARRRAAGRDEHTPVSAAEGSREGVTHPSRAGGGSQRHADLITWQPPEEEGDDEPILGEEKQEPPRRADRERNDRDRNDRDRNDRDRGDRDRGDRDRGDRDRNDRDRSDRGDREGGRGGALTRPAEVAQAVSADAAPRGADGDFAEIFVN